MSDSSNKPSTLYFAQDEALIEAVRDVKDSLDALGTEILVQGADQTGLPKGFESIEDAFQKALDAPLHPSLKPKVNLLETMCYIYTSGTTGELDIEDPYARMTSKHYHEALYHITIINLYLIIKQPFYYNEITVFNIASGVTYQNSKRSL